MKKWKNEIEMILRRELVAIYLKKKKKVKDDVTLEKYKGKIKKKNYFVSHENNNNKN